MDRLLHSPRGSDLPNSRLPSFSFHGSVDFLAEVFDFLHILAAQFCSSHTGSACLQYADENHKWFLTGPRYTEALGLVLVHAQVFALHVLPRNDPSCLQQPSMQNSLRLRLIELGGGRC